MRSRVPPTCEPGEDGRSWHAADEESVNTFATEEASHPSAGGAQWRGRRGAEHAMIVDHTISSDTPLSCHTCTRAIRSSRAC